MSDSIKKWHEMQELSDQGGNYIVPKRGGPALPINKTIMSKMKELDEIAMGIAGVTEELMNDSIDWQLEDFDQDGDDFDAIHSYVMNRAIEYLYKTNTN
jgi:hypothetical protein|tara:strand:- start:224 stop:520 length:297 start_codon:yes stop_codon:yes gene_type:complete